MARFTLTILEDGRAILSTPDKLEPGQQSALVALFKDWSAAKPPEALIVDGCEVVRAKDVQLELAEAGA